MTTPLRIADVAGRAGVSTATVRYYERIGVLPPPRRSDNGYRVYDDVTVERLGFISRSKQLGCSLDEIAELVTAWDGGECGPVQDRLRNLVAEKLAVAQAEIVDLVTLSAELRTAAASLHRHRPTGRCDERCGCTTDTAPATDVVAIALSDKPSSGDAPISCTLPADRVGDRIDEWNALLGAVPGAVGPNVRRSPIDGGIRIEFVDDVDLTEVLRLAAAEQDCCRFFAFSITIDDRGIALEVTAPPAALDVVHAAFGAPD